MNRRERNKAAMNALVDRLAGIWLRLETAIRQYGKGREAEATWHDVASALDSLDRLRARDGIQP